MPRPLLIDTDPGIDDALALLVAFASPEVSVEAISTVAGNVGVEVATDNVFRILDVLQPAHPPRVARGAAAPLVRPLVIAAHVHGEDGLGNLHRLREPDGRSRYASPPHVVQMTDGADLILDMAERHGGDLTVVALGPLTNLAMALARDRRRLARIGRLIVMGGAVAVPGNVTPAAEFNFYVDPEAAGAVLGAGLPVTLVPLDVTRQVVLRRPALERALAGRSDRRACFVTDFTAYGFDRAGQWQDPGIVLHDPLAMGVAVDPTVVGIERLHVDVECAGRLTRGLSLADRRGLAPSDRTPANCDVATSVNAEKFLALFLERLCPASA
jgi:purine nucleosidase/pyrimidine-specific ribonucleoside hydrolase